METAPPPFTSLKIAISLTVMTVPPVPSSAVDARFVMSVRIGGKTRERTEKRR